MAEDAERAAPPSLERISRVLLSLATTAILAAAFFAVAWWRAVSGTVQLEELSNEQRQELVEEMLTLSPGIHSRPWYEPLIGYTLRPETLIDLEFDTFTSNELGYRTGPVEKAPGTFRVVFVGDSWTFGTGVREEESFAKVFERIANHKSGLGRRIEAWTLALSGYNTINQLAAFWFFLDRLQPDAVVLCPSSNDSYSGYEVLPNGSLSLFGKPRDGLGDPHPVAYRVGVDSFRYHSRWRLCFRKLRQTEERLRHLGIPLTFYFVARWDPTLLHSLVAEAGLRSSYIMTPNKYLSGSWLNPKPHGHGNPAANEIYGRMVYQTVARTLGWPMLPPAGDDTDFEIFSHPPEGVDWRARSGARLARITRRYVAESFRPKEGASYQTSGPVHPRTGEMGRATTILVRYREGARRLAIDLRRLKRVRSLYPLTITVKVASQGGGTRARTTVPAKGPDPHRFSVEIPRDVRPGQALDITFEANRVTAGFHHLHARSIRIVSIEQRDSQ